ncbi:MULTISPECIES: acyl-CoA dehydrogenase family protein [Sphingobacterium]|jgi:alkylation response protein AidB-like acyl-CoA dehydrogenase|uniref:Acyl-CoA dehydrogenase family protein n=5 Tax=Sphingobacterium TaxID=28453 RepID=A0ACD5C1I8_9SPHI|nr:MULTISPECIES: acyl-CoA dehydrogenase family protein [Sphingobacterium]APU99870.1 acyl-CoA dehydrogenase [Sphingobacterium sp. B29]MCS4163390.1 alkylation response protein AidB-like acyl-CoA dehydrogenase [Sphingobacterium sp. BIGb0116]OFV11566.1 acyl-CoA dehydrogenase [Sphingobacterium sp. HMSC13C05]OJZ14513.1 MAG: acyl-CoA dehydrogenase [Sphingobacterium sp. 40-24]QMV66702.1 acyl-CoA dehydrogenase family protein [Sphingobacterium paramultivorum]
MFIENKQQMDMIRQSARDFAQYHIKPYVMEWDEAQIFPIEVFKKLGEHGFMGVIVPEEYGGSGLGYQEYITVLDEISKVCGSIGLSVAAHNSLCTNHILSFASEEQKKRYLPKLATAEWIGAWGLTETGSGSDAGGMTTFAERDGDHYVLNGSKNFITHAISSSVAVVIARTGAKGDKKGMSAFIVEKGTPGFTAGKKENKLGMRASETACLFFDNCRIHRDQLIGEEGQGFVQALKLLDGGRISIAALSLGIARGAYECALKYAHEREQFGKKIYEFQAVSFALADMATQVEASELLTRQAGYLKDHGDRVSKIGAMAKLYASEAAVSVSNESVQIFGGYGFTKDYPAEKFFRDAKLCTIGEGTSSIQKMVIAREIEKDIL